ncbi:MULTISPECIES: hypothetical protein [unclassified Vibrio]|uniref:hypothetical protein n=1 Tax=unclassified Vibrio TaxID=2614977 RepID=UPI002F42F25C
MRWIVICLIFSSQALATKVLLIESYHSGYSWDASYIEGIKQTLLPSIEFETFQMDTKRLPMEQFERKSDQAFTAYQEFKPDIVMLGDDNALSYMLLKLYDEPISIVFLQLAVQGASTVIPIVTGNQGKAIYSKSELSRWG